MKKQIRFTSLEEQGEALREYSRSLSPDERLRYLYQLQKIAFPNAIMPSEQTDKIVVVFTAEPNESLSDFFKRKARIFEEFK